MNHLVLLTDPSPVTVLAHDIVGSAANKSVLGFLPLGIEHMLLGWDHLLFIAGVVLLAGELRRAAALISIFVAGHSTTLIAATMAGWRVSPVGVDIIIAMSLLFVGVVGIMGRPQRWGWFMVAVGGFGLIHGLGLSTRLQALGLPETGLPARVISFNVGIEIGQLIAIVVLVGLGKLAAKFVTWPKAPQFAYGARAAAGVVAAIVLVLIPPTAAPAVADKAKAASGCAVGPNTGTLPGNGGGHPDKDFYEPDEVSPETDFAHVLGDGYIIVRYPVTLPADKVAALRQFTAGAEGNGVVAGPIAEQQGQLVAFNAFDRMTCAEADVTALREFRDAWHADPRSGG